MTLIEHCLLLVWLVLFFAFMKLSQEETSRCYQRLTLFFIYCLVAHADTHGDVVIRFAFFSSIFSLHFFMVLQPKNATDTDLRREFEMFGAIDRVKIVKNKNGTLRGYAFIVYERERDMKRT